MPRVTPLELQNDQRTMVLHFTTYGTPKTYKLGAGERAGVVNSFRAIYGHVPQTDCEWQNAILMANHALPKNTQMSREQEGTAIFKKIYGHAPNRSEAAESDSFNLISYGLRPTVRNLESERKALPAFRSLFSKLPETATEWDTLRALAYTDVKRSIR